MNMQLCNVVIYDGSDAYVLKFVLECDEILNVTKDAKSKLLRYTDGNGEILKIDPCYGVTLQNILAFEKSEHPEILQRFNEMYF